MVKSMVKDHRGLRLEFICALRTAGYLVSAMPLFRTMSPGFNGGDWHHEICRKIEYGTIPVHSTTKETATLPAVIVTPQGT